MRRRQFLTAATLAAAPAAAMAQAPMPIGVKPAIKITDIKAIQHMPPASWKRSTAGEPTGLLRFCDIRRRQPPHSFHAAGQLT